MLKFTLLACAGFGGLEVSSPAQGPVSSGGPVHQWVRTNPGGGGAIATVGATASGAILAASDLAGVFKSVDDGASWTPLGQANGLNNSHTTCFGFHPTDGETFFVGTGWGIYRTEDGGASFDWVHQDGYIESIAFAEMDPTIGYMAYHSDWGLPGEVYRTNDGGASWAPVAGENLPNTVYPLKVLVHPLDANVVYALGGKARFGCGAANLYRSIDGGVNWARIAAPLGSILDVDLDPTNPSTVFVSTFVANSCQDDQSFEDYLGGDENSGALFRSADGGLTWSKIGDETGIISVSPDPQVIRVAAILFPYDWNASGGIWETLDGGGSWTLIGPTSSWTWGWCTNQYFALAPSFNGFTKTMQKDRFGRDRWYGAFGQWAWASLDGGHSVQNISTRLVVGDQWLSTGVENINGHTLVISEANSDVLYMGGYDIGLWVSRDRGQSWKRTLPDHLIYPNYVWDEGQGGNVTALLEDPGRPGVVWAAFHKEGLGNQDGGSTAGTTSALFKSTDFGEGFVLSTAGLPDGIMFHGLSLDRGSPLQSRTLYMTADGDVYRSQDDGVNWAVVLPNGGLKFTAIDAVDSNLVYAGGENGFWRSTDGGQSWAEVGLADMRGPLVGNFLPTDAGWEGVFEIQADPVRANRVWVVVFGQGKGLYRSDDAGSTWLKLYTDDYLRGVAIAPRAPNVLYLGSSEAYFSGVSDLTSSGILFSGDAGVTWQAANDGMAWILGGRVRISNDPQPFVLAWSPGTGVQMAEIPFPIAGRVTGQPGRNGAHPAAAGR